MTSVRYQAGHPPNEFQFSVKPGTQVHRTITALIEAKGRGITALEMGTWALRLAHYILTLRKSGVAIEMQKELHDGGWHGRYRLLTPCVELSDQREAA